LAGCGEGVDEECQINVIIEFKILNGEESAPPTYQEIHCHMIFDIKMGDFRRKARFVAGGHTTDTPHKMTYASVVSRESTRRQLCGSPSVSKLWRQVSLERSLVQ
jgi:hypothetical protein